jgi:hypothetical protein
MKKLGIVPLLALLLALTLGAAGAWAMDHQITVMNASKDTVKIALVWSGGGVSPVEIAAGESYTGGVPSPIDSVKVTANGKCREATQTFNPQKVDRVIIQCKGDSYTIKLEQMKPAP